MHFEPVIKWSGSKRSCAGQLVKLFPEKIDTYYEPFCGGCSMLRGLLENGNHCKQYVCSDLNSDLISLWNLIKTSPDEISEYYDKLWHELNSDDDKSRKRKYFETVRARFNSHHNPLDFMFIMRTTTNGMPRYNSQGDFNNSFHITRDGITPDKLNRIVHEWSNLLNTKNVQFLCRDYREVDAKENDFVYCDPPYANTKGMYFGGIDNNALFDFLGNLKCKYLLSFDGISGKVDNTYAVPERIYKKHLYIRTGNSSFKRTIGKDRNSIVYESAYLNYDIDESILKEDNSLNTNKLF